MNVDRLNILVAVNGNYITPLKTLICSLGYNNDAIVDIYIMHSCLEDETILDLREFVHAHTGGALHELKVNGVFLKNAAVTSHFSVEMYYRIFASEYLPAKVDRILWLDADIIVNKSLQEFYFSDFAGKSVIVCAHREKNENVPVINEEAVKRLSLQARSVYFNSGVILMNVAKMRESFQHDAAMQLIDGIKTRPKTHEILYPDQDILNILYENDRLTVDKDIYNYQVHYNWYFPNEKDHIRDNVVILHYLGPAKPWKYQTDHFSYKYYWKYYLMFGKKWDYVTYSVKKHGYFCVKSLCRLLKRIIK